MVARKSIHTLIATFVVFLLGCSVAMAEQLLMTLSVDSARVQWQDEFVLRLEIYGPNDMADPEIGVDGLEQFLVKGMGKNLFQVPRGKTKKWIFTYTLNAPEEGTFKLGPAVSYLNGRRFQSNTLFMTVEPALRRAPGQKQDVEPAKPDAREEPPANIAEKTAPKKTAAAPVKVPQSAKEKEQTPQEKQQQQAATKTPAPLPTEQKPSAPPPAKQPKQKIQPPAKPAPSAKPSTSKPAAEKSSPPVQEAPKPVEKPQPAPPVFTAAQIGTRVRIVMETQKTRPHRAEGVTVTLRLLAQLPVENLRFQQDPEFPGFLKYDFPFTTQPKATRIKYQNENYVAYELQRFLLFPLKDGQTEIPPVTADLKVRIPSSSFAAADPVLDLVRTSNSLNFRVQPVKPEAIVGNFVLKNQIVSDAEQTKTVRLILEGMGLLSTFDFPPLTGPGFVAQTHSSSTKSSFAGKGLKSRKQMDIDIQPAGNTIDIVLPAVRIMQFDPGTQRYSYLSLAPLPLKFIPPVSRPKQPPALPQMDDRFSTILLALCCALALGVLLKAYWPEPVRTNPQLERLFRRKNLKLTVSKNAAQKMYRDMAIEIARYDGVSSSLIDVLKQHLPQEEWLSALRAFRKLEATAFAPWRGTTITYQELKDACRRVEALWLQ